MNSPSISQWLMNQVSFKKEYEQLLIESVASQFNTIQYETKIHDWPYLLKCASVLAHSEDQDAKDKALRISQYCLQSQSTTISQKNSAQFILDLLANRRSIYLAREKGLVPPEAASWKNTFNGNLNWIKQGINHSVLLRDGSTMDVNEFQKYFWESLNQYQYISVSAPTSAGKSHLIKKWILEKLPQSESCIIIYTVPTRALISEVISDFQKELSDDIRNSKVNLSSFPYIQFSADGKLCIYVLTQERLQILLRRNPRNIKILIVDEAYKLADGDRGILLQHVIEKCIALNPGSKVIYISPLASNPELLVSDDSSNFSKRFEDITVNQNLIWATQKRGPKWTLELCHSEGKSLLGEIKLPNTPSPASLKLPMFAYFLGQTGGNIIYVNGAADAEKMGGQLRDLIGFDNQIKNKRITDLIDFCEKIVHKEYRLIECLKYGIAFHYGNMPLLIREEVESLFREGIIKYLICTSTLIEGVNLPCKNIFIRSPKRGQSPMESADFWNLAGRAGRWGKDFQGNIFCLDPTIWEAPDAKGLIPIKRATEETLKEQDTLVDFIRSGTPRDQAAKRDSMEAMASYLAINALSYGSVKEIPWMSKIEPEKLEELDIAVTDYLAAEKVSNEIIENHPGISPLAMQNMLIYFENYSGDYERLLIPHASDTNAVGKFSEIFKSFYGYLTNEFGNQSGFIIRQAIVTVYWMQGRQIKRIIEERKRALPSENIHTTIRTVFQDIESVARFKAPKYLSCYNDLLRYFLQCIGKNELIDEIEDITLYLEMGVNTKTQLSLLNLGLSRTSAVELKEFITSDSFSEKECLAWLTNPNNNWKSYDILEIVRKDIERVLSIYIT